MEAHEVLEKVSRGEMSVGEAEAFFRREPFEDMGYAKLDTHRKLRNGAAEVVFCSGKADDHLVSIFQRLWEQNGEVFGTRASRAQYELVRQELPELTYDAVSRIMKIEKPGKKKRAAFPSDRGTPMKPAFQTGSPTW